MPSRKLGFLMLPVFFWIFFGTRHVNAEFNVKPPTYSSAITPIQCDGVPKYWCAYVKYQTGNIVIDYRAYKGAIDYGDTAKWRLDYFYDYYWSNSCSCYLFDQAFGPSSWRTNVILPSYYWTYNQDNNLNSNAGLVKSRFKFKRSIYNGGWYWYSPTLYFWLD